MYQYESPSAAIARLRERGYTEDFNLSENCLVCAGRQYQPDQFEIREVYRFEGESDPADEAVVYGIESDGGVKGILVDGYGYSSTPVNEAMINKLRMAAN